RRHPLAQPPLPPPRPAHRCALVPFPRRRLPRRSRHLARHRPPPSPPPPPQPRNRGEGPPAPRPAPSRRLGSRNRPRPNAPPRAQPPPPTPPPARPVGAPRLVSPFGCPLPPAQRWPRSVLRTVWRC